MTPIRVPSSGSQRQTAFECRFSSRNVIGNQGKITCSLVVMKSCIIAPTGTSIGSVRVSRPSRSITW